MHKNHNSEDQKTSIIDYKIDRSIQAKRYCYYGGIGDEYYYVSQELCLILWYL